MPSSAEPHVITVIGRISHTPDPPGSFPKVWTSGGHHTYQENLGFRMSLPTVPTRGSLFEAPQTGATQARGHFFLIYALAPTESFPVISFCFLEPWPPPVYLCTCLMFSKVDLAMRPHGFPFIFFYMGFFSLELAQVCQGRGSFCLTVTLCLEQPLARSRCSVNTFQMHQHAQGWEWGGLEPVVGCQSCPGTLLCLLLRQDLFSGGCE